MSIYYNNKRKMPLNFYSYQKLCRLNFYMNLEASSAFEKTISSKNKKVSLLNTYRIRAD